VTFDALLLVVAGFVAVGFALRYVLLSPGRESKDARPPYIVAMGALADGDEEAAFREFMNAVRHDSSNADAYLRLGELFLKRGDVARAHQLHRELAARSSLPRELMARVHRALARDLLAFGKLEKAAQSAEEAARLDETIPGALETLLEIRERLGDMEGAFKVKREIAKRAGAGRGASSSELAAYRARQGWALLERGDAKGAERLLREAQRLDPESRPARWVWGLLQEQQGSYAEAIEAWEELLSERPEESASIFRGLERVHFLDGSFSRMEQTYEKFLRQFADHADACFGLARFLRRKGQLDEAVEVCRRGLEAHPESAELQALTLALLLQSGRAAEAESRIDEWISRLGGERETPAGAKPAATRTQMTAGSVRS
jgi:lipopolysaccharide biosynthesis regulator YciM